jgi:hypothetical protein
MKVPNGALCMIISNAVRLLYLPERRRPLLTVLDASTRAAIGGVYWRGVDLVGEDILRNPSAIDHLGTSPLFHRRQTVLRASQGEAPYMRR